MTCQERRDQFLLSAIGSLEPDESAALDAHLATGCVTCAGSSAEALAVAAAVSMQTMPVEPDPSVLDRLMQRVNASARSDDTASARSTATQSADRNRPAMRLFPSLATAATAAIAASVAAVITAGVMWSQMSSQVRDERLLQTPDLKYVSLAGSNTQSKAHGRIFWDADHGYWHVYVFDLAPPPPGKTYELWFIGNDGRKTPAGLFNVSATGEGRIVSQVPPNLGPLAAAAITAENDGGAAQPTGAIQLVGKIE